MTSTPEKADTLVVLRDALRAFAAERDWDQFHTPKNLAISIGVESGELLEKFQWISDAQSAELGPDDLAGAREEMADVLLYLIRLADKLGVDLREAAEQKILLNAKKYPVERARGNSLKHSKL